MTLARPARIAVGLLLPALAAASIGRAAAADLPLRGTLPPPPPIAAEPPPDWSGFHVGISGGFVRAGKQTLETRGSNPQEQALIDAGGLGALGFSTSSYTIGGGIGYDQQLGAGSGIVLGAEADLRYTGLDRSRSATVGLGDVAFELTARQRLDFLGTVRGRLGYAFGPVLVYGTGGFAFGGADLSAKTDMVSALGTIPFDAGHRDGVETGTVYGGGIETRAPRGLMPSFLAADRLSVKVEYLRYDLGSRSVPIHGTGPVFGPGGPFALGETAVTRFRHQGQLLNVGLNYRFAAFD